MAAPKWMHDLDAAFSSCGEVIADGNVRDIFRLVPSKDAAPVWIDFEHLAAELLARDHGYHVLRYNRDAGFEPAGSTDETAWFAQAAPLPGSKKLEEAAKSIAAIFDKAEAPAAIILDAKSMFVMPQSLSDQETEFLRDMDRISSVLHYPPKSKQPHLLLWVFESDRDMPRILQKDTPFRKRVPIHMPDLNERRIYLSERLKDASLSEQQIEELALKTGAMSIARTSRVVESCRILEYQAIWNRLEREMSGAGFNPYEQLGKEKIRQSEAFFNARVIGQELAVKGVAARVRSITFPFINCLKSGGKGPKAVFFFAGPTGVGKTEMAKCLSELVFGSGEKMYRIDLSEYKEAHTVARLIGSPPGYVGHDDGGQLTERILRTPFQLVLLDEIDKPHDSVHDILLSILDAGRLTDGKGRVADFSQSMIVLTSNLGAATAQHMFELNPDVEYSAIDAAVREEIRNFYVNRLGRPELYSRLIDSLVVFDFIRKDAQVQLLRKKLQTAIAAMKLSNGIDVSGLEIAEAYLVSKTKEYIIGGGRGIVKCVEKHFLEPIANLIYDRDIHSGTSIRITNCLDSTSGQTEIVFE